MVQKAKTGDDQALNHLMERYLPRVLKIVRMRMGAKLRSQMESMDMVQDVMQRALKGFDQFDLRHEGAFLHWLRKMVQHEILEWSEHYNAQMRDPNKEIHSDGADGRSVLDDIPTDSVWNQSLRLHLKDDVLRLEQAMDDLSEEHREIIIMRQHEDLSFPEIGKILKCTEDAARMKYARAMNNLTNAMTKNA